MRIAILGAGAVGSSIAAHLAEHGDHVTVIDLGLPGSGTSGTSFGWVNSNGKEPEDYFEINRAGMEAHRSSPGSEAWLGRGGHVEIAVDEDHVGRLEERIARLQTWDYAVSRLTVAEAESLMPGVRVPSAASLVASFPQEGFAYPALYIGAALQRAQAAGAEFVFGSAVVGLRESAAGGASVLLDDGTTITADFVVSAVGRWTAGVAQMAGATIPMLPYTTPGDETVGYLVETEPLPVVLDHIVTSPALNFRPAGGGRLLLQALDLDASANPTEIPDASSPIGEEFLRRLKGVVRGADGAEKISIRVGQRALPSDGRTVAGLVDELPWLYVVATHSGITLAPFLGSAIADELHGRERPELVPFRPSRFRHGSPYLLSATPRQPGEQ